MKRRRKQLSKATVCGVIILTLVICAILTYKQVALKAQVKEYSSQIKELERRQDELDKEKKELEKFKDYVKTV